MFEHTYIVIYIIHVFVFEPFLQNKHFFLNTFIIFIKEIILNNNCHNHDNCFDIHVLLNFIKNLFVNKTAASWVIARNYLFHNLGHLKGFRSASYLM